jgi:ABC-type proline/glycine betaine transport system permease subunit
MVKKLIDYICLATIWLIIGAVLVACFGVFIFMGIDLYKTSDCLWASILMGSIPFLFVAGLRGMIILISGDELGEWD